MATKKPDAFDRIKRRTRLETNTRKGTFPTTEGDKPLNTKGPSTGARVARKLGQSLQDANKMRDKSDAAAEGINARKKYKDVE